MKPINHVSGLEALHSRYDTFLVDAWGVLHDGTGCYPGVKHCLEQLVGLCISAGTIARLYQSLGGETVIYYGKPGAEIFEMAVGKSVDKSGVLMVGDGFETDIAGAVG